MKVPHSFTMGTYQQPVIKMNGLSVIESCRVTPRQGTMFLEDHLLLVVLHGKYVVRFGDQEHVVHENEMVLLQKSIVVEYEKQKESDTGDLLDYMMFFLKEEIINEFLKMASPKNIVSANPLTPIIVNPVNQRLTSYIESLRPYFCESNHIDENLVKLKLLELLFDLTAANEHFLQQITRLRRPPVTISEVVEENIFNPVTLNDLAYLSGRSLSSFKRDFQKIYNTSPLQWIKNRRLDKAKELIIHSSLSITDICFQVGFQNVSHFSTAFKEWFGVSPTSYRQEHHVL